MDLASIVGLALGIAALVLTAVLEGTHFSALVNIPAFVLIIFGSFGAMAMSFTWGDVARLAFFVKEAFFTSHGESFERAKKLVEMAQAARRDGVLALEGHAEQIEDAFFRSGMQHVIDGSEPQMVRDILENELALEEERQKAGDKMFEALGGYAPTLGVMGAVLGLMHALGQSDDPQKMAAAIAVAFVATLYGVGFANLLFLPIASKLKVRVAERRQLCELTIEGIASIQCGENPRFLVSRLVPYLPESERAKFVALFDSGGGRG
ncbi:MAG: flagellar motor protein [Candidatus Schekmanbacteria bacterium]|nr:flagellar motor protein [Candidatus Schekmanbacteria bacterium]